MAEQALPSSGRGPMALTLVSAAVTTTVVALAQSGPGFGWDAATAGWIHQTIPYLTETAALATWPLGAQWPFAGAVLVAVLSLSVFRHQKAALFLLASVAGGLLMDWCLRGLLPSLSPETGTLLYATAFGGLALALSSELSRRWIVILWTVAAIAVTLAGLATVATGGLISAALMSVLLGASWLLVMRQLTT